jgi:hypothetical protein
MAHRKAKAPSDPIGAALERSRRACLSLPEATEKLAWGAPTFRVKEKLFAMFSDGHHGDGRISLLCHAPKGAQVVLVSSEPHRYFVPPYVGPKGWIGLILSEFGYEELLERVREAYVQVAPKRLRARTELDQDA